MKKIIFFILILVLGIVGLEFYDRHTPEVKQWAQNLKSGQAIENLYTQIFTPGGLRAKIESKTAFLSIAGTIQKTNEQRLQFGKFGLRENSLLNKSAMAKVKDMFAGQYFEHLSPLGKGPGDLAKEAGYVYISVGENLALGNYKDDEELVQAWMDSPGHRANILNGQFTEIGVAVLKGQFEGKTTWLAVQEFGRPASECPKVDEFLKEQIDVNANEITNLGNQIKALENELETSSKPSNPEEIEAYNKKVESYNAIIKVYNNSLDNQKELVNRYNHQVKSFNLCIE